MQTFQYPNLLVNSRSRTLYFNSKGKNLPGVRMRDGVVGDYQRVTLDADAKGWAYLYMIGAAGVGDVPEGTELVISCFARVNGAPCKLYPSICLGNGTGLMHDFVTTTWDDVGGGGPSASRGRRGMPSRTTRRCSTSASVSTRRGPRTTSHSRWCALRTSPTPGHRQKGRCGLNER